MAGIALDTFHGTQVISGNAQSAIANDQPPLVKTNSSLVVENIDVTLDNKWLQQAFMISDITLADPNLILNRTWSSANDKFTDTRMGGSIGINARPQFCPYSDIRVKGRISNRSDVTLDQGNGDYGMGRYYSESIDDNAQTIFLRFGVPEYNSLSNFLMGAFDSGVSSLARTGSGNGLIYKIAEGIGAAVSFSAFPIASMMLIGGQFLSQFVTGANSKFYKLKPTMPLYWSTVNSLVNNLAVNMGILPRIFSNPNSDPSIPADQKINTKLNLDQDSLDTLSEMMPDLFTADRAIDVYAIANRAQRMANVLFTQDYDNFDEVSKKSQLGVDFKTTSDSLADPRGEHSLANIIQRLGKSTLYYNDNSAAEPRPPLPIESAPPAEGGTAAPTTPAKTATPTDTATTIQGAQGIFFNADGTQRSNVANGLSYDDIVANPADAAAAAAKNAATGLGEFYSNLKIFLEAELSDGSMFATFRVDSTGSVSEAFGNSVVESDISTNLNGLSSTAREARFTFANGNLVGGAVGAVAGAALDLGADVLTGALSGLTMGVSDAIKGLLGEGFIDIPKHWQSSNATLPRANYNIQLISPYGNAISQLQNIYIPLCMIMAGSLPLSTGRSSYTSPFIVQLFDRGRCQIQTGMIESVSITRGTSNLGFTRTGNAMAIDVSFSIVDLSSIMHMPISSGGMFNFNAAIDEDNILYDYLAVLAGQDVYSQIYWWPKARLKMAKYKKRLDEMTSSAKWSSMLSNTGLFRLMTGPFHGSNATEGN
jgi:hypothetical protein